jgi:hypothetical protein
VTLDAQLPPALERVESVRRIYPDLFRLSHPLAARGERPMPSKIGPKLAQRVSARYANTHRCSQYAIEHRAENRGVVTTSEVVWGCDDVPLAVRTFLHCETEPGREGGRDTWGRMFGGRIYPRDGLPPGNAVLNPWQIRPAWVSVYEDGGFYTRARDSWTTRKADIATHPYHAPLIAWMIYRKQGRSAWATEAECA